MKIKKKKPSPSKEVQQIGDKKRGVASADIIRLVINIAEPLCTSAGMELVHVEYQREAGGRTLRIYLDKPGGVTLDDCAVFSRQLSDLLDVGLDTDLSYRMEVSSPGPDRPLGKPADFKRFKGSKARIKMKVPVDGKKTFTGRILGIEENEIELSGSSGTIRIKYESIKKARLVNYNGEN
ncbi:MAG: ribosome maturation factor RimP [Desulfobacteraceae bacterium]|nr:ribosome maturation factor RimP [Desulfobacteraceae bacterium]